MGSQAQLDQTVGCNTRESGYSKWGTAIAIDWVTGRSSQKRWLNVQSGPHNAICEDCEMLKIHLVKPKVGASVGAFLSDLLEECGSL